MEKKEVCYKATELLARIFRENLAKNVEEASWFARALGLTQEVIDQYQIGYCPKEGAEINEDEVPYSVARVVHGITRNFERHSIVFPITDVLGRIIDFHTIPIPELKKHKCSACGDDYHPLRDFAENGEIIFGLKEAREEIKHTGEVVVTEKVTDCLFLVKNGIKNTVALCCFDNIEAQVRVLRRIADIGFVCPSDVRVASDFEQAARKVGWFCETLTAWKHDVLDILTNEGPNAVKQFFREKFLWLKDCAERYQQAMRKSPEEKLQELLAMQAEQRDKARV